jgi:hypothetical protein
VKIDYGTMFVQLLRPDIRDDGRLFDQTN